MHSFVRKLTPLTTALRPHANTSDGFPRISSIPKKAANVTTGSVTM